MKKSIGFIGGGRITRIFLQAFSNKKAEFTRIVVDEINNDVRLSLQGRYKNFSFAEGSVAASQDIVFIALHPPVIMEALELLKNNFKSSTVIISLAPKVSIEKISSKLPKVKKIARLIPNATSYINEGFNPVSFSKDFGKGDKKEILEILSILGKTIETPEVKLESYAILSAMLPTYFWFQWKELADIGQKIGLNEKESVESIHETLVASLNLMYKSGLTPNEVMDLIPVKPIAEHEGHINEFYNKKLLALYDKIKP